jgi:hypothetical protein
MSPDSFVSCTSALPFSGYLSTEESFLYQIEVCLSTIYGIMTSWFHIFSCNTVMRWPQSSNR